MLCRRVIPCLDVADGRVVKGTRFVDLVDEGDPPELAERYAREGADELVFLDITAAPERRGTLLDIVERTARRAFIPLTVGGGVRSVDEMRDVLRAGADKVSLNTAAVAEPELITACARRFGSQAVVVAIDALRTGSQLDGLRQGRPRGHTAPCGQVGTARGRARGGRTAGHVDRPRWDRPRLRHRAAPCDHRSRVRAGHRLGWSRRAGGLRRRDPRRRRGRRACRLDLPPADPFDRVGQGGDGRCRVAGPGDDRGRGVTVDPQYRRAMASSRRSSRTPPTGGC